MIYLALGLHLDHDNHQILTTDDFGNFQAVDGTKVHWPHAYEYEAPEPKPLPELI